MNTQQALEQAIANAERIYSKDKQTVGTRETLAFASGRIHGLEQALQIIRLQNALNTLIRIKE